MIQGSPERPWSDSGGQVGGVAVASEMHPDLAELYVTGPFSNGGSRSDASGGSALPREGLPPPRFDMAAFAPRRSGFMSLLLPLCVLSTGGCVAGYLYLFMHSLPMACMVGALGLVGALFCRELLR